MRHRNLDALYEPSQPCYGLTHTGRAGAGVWYKPKVQRDEEDDPARVSVVEEMVARIRQRKGEVS